MCNLKQVTMKKTLFLVFIMSYAGVLYGQGDPVNNVFEKYLGKEGFSTITITGDMLDMMTKMQEESKDTVLQSKLSSVKILVTDKESDNRPTGIDFMTEVYSKLNKTVYKELMTVKEAGEDVIILARGDNDLISEVLIIIGGKENNALIQITGSILLRELADLTGDIQFNGLEQLKKLEK